MKELALRLEELEEEVSSLKETVNSLKNIDPVGRVQYNHNMDANRRWYELIEDKISNIKSVFNRELEKLDEKFQEEMFRSAQEILNTTHRNDLDRMSEQANKDLLEMKKSFDTKSMAEFPSCLGDVNNCDDVIACPFNSHCLDASVLREEKPKDPGLYDQDENGDYVAFSKITHEIHKIRENGDVEFYTIFNGRRKKGLFDLSRYKESKKLDKDPTENVISDMSQDAGASVVDTDKILDPVYYCVCASNCDMTDKVVNKYGVPQWVCTSKSDCGSKIKG